MTFKIKRRPPPHDPHRKDDGTDPSKEVLEYINAIHPAPIRILGKTMGEISEIAPERSHYIIQQGDLCGLEIREIKISAENFGSILPSPTIFSRLKFLYLRECQLDSLKNFPSYPKLEELSITDSILCSLEGLPSEFHGLEAIGIHCSSLLTLKGFPSIIPNLKKIIIMCSSLNNLKGLPAELPHLEFFMINCPSLLNLEDFPCSLPILEKLFLSKSDLRFLKPFKCDAPNLKEIDINGARFRDFTFVQIFGEIFHKNILYGRYDKYHPQQKKMSIQQFGLNPLICQISIPLMD
ncbi:MAG: hypothetical protein ACTSVZ_00080 [Promethearchaeota archaeon]